MIIEEILARLYYSIYTMAMYNPAQKLWDKLGNYIDRFPFMQKRYKKFNTTAEEARQFEKEVVSAFHLAGARRLAFSLLLVFSVFTYAGLFYIIEKTTGFRLQELESVRYSLICVPIILGLWYYSGRREKIYIYCERFDKEPRKKKVKWRIITIIWAIMSYILMELS